MDNQKLGSEHWTRIFRVLAIVLVADGRVYKEEVDCFVQQVTLMQAQFDNDLLVTPQMAFDWFNAHRDAIKAEVHSDQSHFHIVRSLQSLSNFHGTENVLRAMEAVALSDGDFHKAEIAVLELASAQWGVEFSPPS